MTDTSRWFTEIRSYKRARVLAVAVHVGVFAELNASTSPRTVSALAGQLAVSEVWLGSVLRALASIGLVEEGPHGYCLTEDGFAIAGDAALRPFAGYHVHCFEAWLYLPNSLHAGIGQGFHASQLGNPNFCRAYLQVMESITVKDFKFLYKYCGPLMKGRILDLGAGPAVLTRALAAEMSTRSVVALDYPEMTMMAATLYDTPSNFQWTGADFYEWTAPSHFNAIFIGHLLEYVAIDRLDMWLSRTRGMLQTGGTFAAVLFLHDDVACRTETNEQALAFFEISTGLNGPALALIMTREEAANVLRRNGFADVSIVAVPGGLTYREFIMTATAV